MIRFFRTVHEQVVEFHTANDQPILHKPQVPADDRVRLRLALIAEEFFELIAATYGADGRTDATKADVFAMISDVRSQDVDLVEVADALADLDYVVEGTRLEFGINGEPIADEVHRSNLSKLGADGKPVRREDGKIMKGPNYSPPDIAGELRKQGWEG
jgi:predicted HAD superfamily Cof-like phosphohydrolase